MASRESFYCLDCDVTIRDGLDSHEGHRVQWRVRGKVQDEYFTVEADETFEFVRVDE